MKVQNKSRRTYQHGDYKLLPGCVLEVSEEVAKAWTKSGEVVEYVSPEDARAIEAENAKLKAELEAIKKAETAEEEKKETKKTKKK